MDTKNLVTLKTILEEGSFQKAAQRLNYTQSTVSAQIDQLERELSVQLFERIGRRMRLSQAGQELLPEIETILQAAEKLTRYNCTAGELSGQLRVAAPESFLCYQMQPTLKTFRELAPQVRLSLRSADCYEIHQSILSGEVDVGVDYQIQGCSQSIRTQALASYRLTLICAKDFDVGLRDFITPHQLKPVNLIASNPNNLYRQIFERYLQQKDIILDDTMELWSIEARKKSVASNLGVSCMPYFTVEQELKAGVLDQIPVEIPGGSITAYGLYHKNKWMTPAMKLFFELLQQTISRQNGTDYL